MLMTWTVCWRFITSRFKRETLEEHGNFNNLIEVVLDLGEGRKPGTQTVCTIFPRQRISAENTSLQCSKRVGEFGLDNRAGIEEDTAPISAIRNRQR